MSDDYERDRPVVVVTGFGPFAKHPTNASWEAVKELKNSDIEKELNIRLITKEIPVAYDSVLTEVPRLWSEHKPTLVVHVGVSAQADRLTLESRANVSGYNKQDVKGVLAPAANINGPGRVMETEIDVWKIRDEMNCCKSSSADRCDVTVSTNAGLYLCEYIYSQSLLIQPRNTMFVHVPELCTYPATKTANGLYDIVRLALSELVEIEDNCL